MAEVQIDQSSLPRVQEVCQSFAVLEDGVLAHNLQEQEIEQYYTTNIQKNQLVQNDIRVAKQLQDEEEEQQAQQSALLRQESRQLEEQDFEYARVIQEEIQRTSEEAWKREQDDEEIARQMQEEEEQRMRRTRVQEEYLEGSFSGSAPPSPKQFTLNQHHQDEAQYSPTTTRWQYFNTSSHPDYCRPPVYYPGRVTDHKTINSWSDEGHANSRAALRRALEETQMHADCEDSVYLEQRPNKRHNTAPLHRRSSLRLPRERDYRTLYTPDSITEEFHCWEKYENGDKDKRRARDWERERSYRTETGTWTMYSNQNEASRSVAVGERPCRRSESVRLHDAMNQSRRDSTRTWTYRDNPDKHVHFAANTGSSNKRQDTNMEVWEMLGHVLKERGVPVSLGGSGAPLKIGPQSRHSQVLHGSRVFYGDSQPPQTPFQRAASARHSFHGDIRERRRLSHRENSERDHRGSDDSHYGELYEISSRDSSLSNREVPCGRCWGEHRPDYEYESYGMVRRTAGRHWHNTIERFCSEEEMERGVEQPLGRALGSSWARSRRMAAGTSPTPRKGQTTFNMGELQQVLRDEVLARKLQEEESQFARHTHRCYPQGDFRVAQVAQDEEIAHYMQNQEVKLNRRSREFEGPASWREHRAMMNHHDRRTARERQVQRERLDSEGLPSPTEDCPPENQPPSIVSTPPQSQQLRNIAEELDPTFQARSQGADILQMGQTGPISQSLPEEPTFIPPTKRPTEKPGRAKSKEKKEN
nr:coiled-coil domain-containing protein 187 isoform X2 [Doryrhamphus excisus]